jgi:hypothetical protein
LLLKREVLKKNLPHEYNVYEVLGEKKVLAQAVYQNIMAKV